MFTIIKHEPKPITIIRAASAIELIEYEKQKQAKTEEAAEENKINTWRSYNG